MKIIDFPIGSYKEVEGYKSTFRKKMITLLRSIGLYPIDPCCQDCEQRQYVTPVYPTGAYQYVEKATSGDETHVIDLDSYYTQIEYYDADTGAFNFTLPNGLVCGQMKKVEYYRDETTSDATITLVEGNFCGTEDDTIVLKGNYSYVELMWLGCWKIMAIIEDTDI